MERSAPSLYPCSYCLSRANGISFLFTVIHLAGKRPLRGANIPTKLQTSHQLSEVIQQEVPCRSSRQNSQKHRIVMALCAEYAVLPSLCPCSKSPRISRVAIPLPWLFRPQTWESIIRPESCHKLHPIISKIPIVSNSKTSETFFTVPFRLLKEPMNVLAWYHPRLPSRKNVFQQK